MIHYKKALLKLKKNKIKIKSELISVESSLNRISALDINSPNNYPAYLPSLPFTWRNLLCSLIDSTVDLST